MLQISGISSNRNSTSISGRCRVDKELQEKRGENNDDENAYDTVKLRVNCKSKTVGIIDLLSYDTIGNLASELHEKSPADKKVVKGSIEEMLFKEVCN